MKKYIAALFCIGLISSSNAVAQSTASQFTYDLSGGFGTYNGNSYTEVDLGLNWYLTNYLNWRNSVFTQFGSTINTVYGLDTAAIFGTGFYSSGGTLGVDIYAGPGLRFANEDSSGVFAKGGVTFTLAGLRIGGGVQLTRYYETRHDKDRFELPQDEVQYFIVLSGGGGF